MTQEIIRLHELRKVYQPGDTLALDDLTLSVARGEILALVGPSGCGKTTLLRLIAGFEVPDGGRIDLDGRTVAGGASFVPPEQRGVGMVFQEYALFPHLSVLDNVAFGLRHLARAEAGRRAREVLALVGLGELAGRYPHELSGGQQQRVALARALAPNPEVVLLDEPFSNLDADLRAEVRREVAAILRGTGRTAIFVTHDQEEAFVLADRVGVLHRGRLEQLEAPEAIYHRPATRFVADFVGQADFLPGVIKPEGAVTEIGLFANDRALPVGLPVEVMIRPDDVLLFPHPTGSAEVADREFRGSDNLYRVRLPSGQVIHSSQDSSNILAPGAKVRVRVKPCQPVIFASIRPWV
jgi:iron(III) transport system ATP-binding protein